MLLKGPNDGGCPQVNNLTSTSVVLYLPLSPCSNIPYTYAHFSSATMTVHSPLAAHQIMMIISPVSNTPAGIYYNNSSLFFLEHGCLLLLLLTIPLTPNGL